MSKISGTNKGGGLAGVACTMLLALPLFATGGSRSAWRADALAAAATSSFSAPAAVPAEHGWIVPVDDWEQVPPNGGADSVGTDSGSVGAATEPHPEGHPQRGPDAAPITIVEYSDFQCPYCRASESTLRQVRSKYSGEVRLVYMDYPLKFHPQAMGAALAARCAQEQGQFWQYHDALFSNQGNLSAVGLKSLARRLGLDGANFDSCFDQRKYEGDVLADREEGKQTGVAGTPYFLVNGRPLSGAQPLASFETMINSDLRASSRR